MSSRFFANLTAATFVGLVVFSGFGYPLHYSRGFWPFNCDWFMFSYDTGYDFELQAQGLMKDGSRQLLDVTPFFSLQVGGTSNRFQEAPRDVVNMRRLAEYLCTKFPAQAISINEVTWPRGAGKPPRPNEVDPKAKTTSPWVTDVPCGS